MVLTQLVAPNSFKGDDLSFHTTMVLTQQLNVVGITNVSKVSIPLWFSRNLLLSKVSRRETQSFHTTMVLTQLSPDTGPTAIRNEFPYHYGSHAT